MVLPASLVDRFSLDVTTVDYYGRAVVAIHHNGLCYGWLRRLVSQGGTGARRAIPPIGLVRTSSRTRFHLVWVSLTLVWVSVRAG
jgi:hypothetical protein